MPPTLTCTVSINVLCDPLHSPLGGGGEDEEFEEGLPPSGQPPLPHPHTQYPTPHFYFVQNFQALFCLGGWAFCLVSQVIIRHATALALPLRHFPVSTGKLFAACRSPTCHPALETGAGTTWLGACKNAAVPPLPRRTSPPACPCDWWWWWDGYRTPTPHTTSPPPDLDFPACHPSSLGRTPTCL